MKNNLIATLLYLGLKEGRCLVFLLIYIIKRTVEDIPLHLLKWQGSRGLPAFVSEIEILHHNLTIRNIDASDYIFSKHFSSLCNVNSSRIIMHRKILLFLCLVIVIISDVQALKRVLKRRKMKVQSDEDSSMSSSPSLQIETPDKSVVTRNHRNGRCKLSQCLKVTQKSLISQHFKCFEVHLFTNT